eukprot:GHVS01084821.1.p1 GENE.GHVS01084821.1~~GHVS01084821.1.p1  ORF type:complete len:111 (-),score=8.88 GHVS01084821.1:125-457(-)
MNKKVKSCRKPRYNPKRQTYPAMCLKLRKRFPGLKRYPPKTWASPMCRKQPEMFSKEDDCAKLEAAVDTAEKSLKKAESNIQEEKLESEVQDAEKVSGAKSRATCNPLTA